MEETEPSRDCQQLLPHSTPQPLRASSCDFSCLTEEKKHSTLVDEWMEYVLLKSSQNIPADTHFSMSEKKTKTKTNPNKNVLLTLPNRLLEGS